MPPALTVGRTPRLAAPARARRPDHARARQRRPSAAADGAARCWRSESRGCVPACRHARLAADRIRSSQQSRCMIELACGERGAYGGARRPLAVDDDRRHRLDAERRRGRRSSARSPLRPRPKRKSSPTSTQRAPSRRTRTSSMKRSGGQRRQRGVEARDMDCAQRRTPRIGRACCATWTGAAARLPAQRIRADADRRSARPTAGAGRPQPRQPREHRLVAAMDAVEVADGQREGRWRTRDPGAHERPALGARRRSEDLEKP